MIYPGWSPRLSRYGQSFALTRVKGPAVEVYDLATTECLARDPRCQKTTQVWWIDKDTIVWRQEQLNAPQILWRYRIGGHPEKVGPAPGTQFTAADGHWASWGPASGAVRYDGIPVAHNCGGTVVLSGDLLGHLAKPDTDKPGQTYIIRSRATPIEKIALRGRPFDPCLLDDPAGPVLVYGGRGGPIWGWQGGSATNLTAAPAPWRESQPRVLRVDEDLWVGSIATCEGHDRGIVLLRPWGDKRCIQMEYEAGIRKWDVIGLDVGKFVIAVEDDNHDSSVGEAGTLEERSLVDPPRSQSKPYAFFFGKHSDHYGDNRACPGTAAVVCATDTTDEGAALERAELASTPMILGASLIEHMHRWNLVRAVYVLSEDAKPDAIERTAKAAKIAIATRGLKPKPIVSYTARHAHLAPSVDWIGIEAYLDKGESAAAFEARVRVGLDRCKAASRKAALIWGSFDRQKKVGVPWVNLITLRAVHERIPALLTDYDTTIAAVLVFSDGRAGGCRDHPDLYAAHRKALEGLT
jgi:hypothetical protein